MNFKEVYLSLGGNIGDSSSILKAALAEISQISEIKSLETSHFYLTTPVGNGPFQQNFTNCVCRFSTILSPFQLLRELQKIEVKLGKVPKAKHHPRILDIDILFYAAESYNSEELEIPHPRWKERLFVLIPLADLTKQLRIPQDFRSDKMIDVELIKMIETHQNSHQETVLLIN